MGARKESGKETNGSKENRVSMMNGFTKLWDRDTDKCNNNNNEKKSEVVHIKGKSL